MRPPFGVLGMVFLLLALGAATPVHAHQVSLTYSNLIASGNVIQAEITVPTSELDNSLSYRIPVNGEGLQAAFESFLAESFHIESNGVACPLSIAGTEVAQDTQLSEEMITIHGTFVCPETLGTLSITNTFFTDFFPEQQNSVHLSSVQGEQALLFTADHTMETVRIDEKAPGLLSTIQAFILMGMIHIYTGFDHILFLLGIIVAGTQLKSMLKIVTGFTIGHSITLALSVLGILSLPPELTETLIALTIFFIGLENIFWRGPEMEKRRPLLTFVFGFIHGMGFAGALKEIHIPASQIIPTLLSFNLGIEISQLTILVLAFPFVIWMNKQPWRNKAVLVVSGLVSLAGVIWFIERAGILYTALAN